MRTKPLIVRSTDQRLDQEIKSLINDLQWKMNFGGRRPSVEETLRSQMTFSGRQPLVFLRFIAFISIKNIDKI